MKSEPSTAAPQLNFVFVLCPAPTRSILPRPIPSGVPAVGARFASRHNIALSFRAIRAVPPLSHGAQESRNEDECGQSRRTRLLIHPACPEDPSRLHW